MSIDRIAAQIRDRGFVFVGSGDREIAKLVSMHEWRCFAESWNDMPRDEYMADGGRYRRRRYKVFSMESGKLQPQPHQAHYQTLDNNPLNGGIERWFAPIMDDVARSGVLRELILLAHRTFSAIAPAVASWHVEVHQFRIEASSGSAGKPTPEGMHRDGRDFVLVMLISRVNVASGTTELAEPGGRALGSFTLENAGDCVLLDDNRVCHGVTPILPLDAGSASFRDVLVVTFKAGKLDHVGR